MKQIKFILLCFGAFNLFSCRSSGGLEGEFRLLPVPQQFEITGASSLRGSDIQSYFAGNLADLPVRGELLKSIQPVIKSSQAQILCEIEYSMDLKDEGYTLAITRNKIVLTGKDRAGLMYGFMTLEQLMEDAQEQDIPLPMCRITDYPLLSYRAIHLDLKHHRMKSDYYYRLLDNLARYKVNAIIAEMEDKLAYERQPEVGSPDALSINEWKKLSEYAMERNIEISPLIQGLGHASFILKHDIYKDIRDDPESDWAFNPLDPKTYEVQFDLYLDAIEATPYGKYLHVGGDEVHTTGRGSGKSPLELQLNWLDKVSRFAQEHGRIPIFWDDMPIKHADLYRPMFDTKLTREEIDNLWKENEHKLVEFLDLFPKNCIYMRWNYSSPHAKGNIKAMEWFLEHGFQVMGATAGQTRWVLMPQNESNMENIRSFATTSIKKGLDGLLLTLWDDDSPHFELYMRGILAFAEYTWSGDQRGKEEIKAAYRQREFSQSLAGSEYAFVDQLEQSVAWWNNSLLKRGRRNDLQALSDPAEERVIDLPTGGEKGTWAEKYAERLELAAKVLKDCKEVASRIETSMSMAIQNQYRLEVYEQVNNLVQFSANALLVMQAYDVAQNEQDEAEALNSIRNLSEEFEILTNHLEKVYGETRILSKPEGYLLDQDHHHHLANQAISFDWQFVAELLFLEKIEKEFNTEL